MTNPTGEFALRGVGQKRAGRRNDVASVISGLLSQQAFSDFHKRAEANRNACTVLVHREVDVRRIRPASRPLSGNHLTGMNVITSLHAGAPLAR